MSAPTLAQTLLPARYRRLSILLFFAGILGLGLAVLRDYSVPGDEEIQRMTGEVSLLYVFQKLPAGLQQRLLSPQAAALIVQKGASTQLQHWRDRDYGVAFELPAAALERVLGLHEPRQFFLLRHLLNFLVCFGGFGTFYRLAARRFGSWRVGLLGTLLLVLSPRLFADNFYNSKDAVFLALFTMAVATAVPFVARPIWPRALGCALACALAIDVRLMGVLVPAATLALLGWRVLRGEYPASARQLLAVSSLYVVVLAGVVVAGWPFLWEAPLANFLLAWRNMSHFRAGGSVLYQGQYFPAQALPWHYALVWILLTVPLLDLLLFGLGTLAIAARVLERRGRLYAGAEWQDLLFLALTLAPLAAVMGLHSVLYNGWRQLYFLLPMLLLLALRGLVAAWRWQPPGWLGRRYWQPTLATVVAGALAVVAARMVQLHPLENLYFNALAPTPVERYYETDYWGLGLRRGLEWVLAHDSRPSIRVSSNALYPAVLGRQMLPTAARHRLVLADSAVQADYYLDAVADHGPALHHQPLHTLWADNVRVLDIYRLAPAPTPAPRAVGRAGE